MERLENKKQVKKAMILAGGLGTRFLPATLCLAKELFPIGNMPIIMYHIEDLVKAGINDILIVGNKLKEESFKNFLTPSKEYLNNILRVLDNQGVEYEIDDTLVRGLDYYSHVVFEYHFITENGTSLGAVGAGGHYDNLLKDVGGPSLSSVGLAFGVERLNLLLKEIKPEEYAKVELDAYLICLGKENLDKVFSLCSTLRNNGFNVDMSFENKSMGASFKIATRKNAKFAIIIGENEIANNIVKLKDLNSQEQIDVSLKDLIEVLDEKLVD